MNIEIEMKMVTKTFRCDSIIDYRLWIVVCVWFGGSEFWFVIRECACVCVFRVVKYQLLSELLMRDYLEQLIW